MADSIFSESGKISYRKLGTIPERPEMLSYAFIVLSRVATGGSLFSGEMASGSSDMLSAYLICPLSSLAKKASVSMMAPKPMLCWTSHPVPL